MWCAWDGCDGIGIMFGFIAFPFCMFMRGPGWPAIMGMLLGPDITPFGIGPCIGGISWLLLFIVGVMGPFAFGGIGLPIGGALMLLMFDSGLLPIRAPFEFMFGELRPKWGLALPIRPPFGPIMFGELMFMLGLELLSRDPFGEFMPRCTFGPIWASCPSGLFMEDIFMFMLLMLPIEFIPGPPDMGPPGIGTPDICAPGIGPLFIAAPGIGPPDIGPPCMDPPGIMPPGII